ncbi:hypothetical protein U9M48_031570 [Paspalum notatum var. saurae]|uniref:Uncharacterized protein n=1 Tax=Paspalum notatum var. saurae TaxID=547442 RepID=A0AAQ3U737_PASNO
MSVTSRRDSGEPELAGTRAAWRKEKDWGDLQATPWSLDPAIEEETVQEQPLIEEPEEEQENQQPTVDPAAKETNPNEEEGAEFLFCACVGGGPCPHQE